MPCIQVSPGASAPGPSKTQATYKTEAECLQACTEGACCEGTTCSIKPQCQCQGTGKTFKGAGTVCEPNPCGCCCINEELSPSVATEQQCSAAGGMWKSCDTTPPPILLTVSLTNYTVTIPGGFFAGTRDIDFSCFPSTFLLSQFGSGVFVSQTNPRAFVYASESAADGDFDWRTKCPCKDPALRFLSIHAHPDAVSTRLLASGQRTVLDCSLAPTAQDAFIFRMIPHGQSYDFFNGNAFSVAGFCSGQYSVSGYVSGVGGVNCGTWTIGNPLP